MKKSIIIILTAVLSAMASISLYAVESGESIVVTDRKPAKKKAEIREVVFHVHLHCENCVKKVQENINYEKGVKGLEVSLENQTVALKYDPAKTSEATLKAAIEKLGYHVEVL